MKDRTLEQIRERDKSYGEKIPEHYQGPNDRRYLLKIIDLLEKKLESSEKEVAKYESNY